MNGARPFMTYMWPPTRFVLGTSRIRGLALYDSSTQVFANDRFWRIEDVISYFPAGAT